MIARIGAADLCLELEDGFPKPAVVEQQPRLQVGLREPEIGIGRHGLRVDVQAYRTRQLSGMLAAEDTSSRGDEDQPMRATANRGCRQPLHEELAVISCALLDCDEKVALLLETILERLMADD